MLRLTAIFVVALGFGFATSSAVASVYDNIVHTATYNYPCIEAENNAPTGGTTCQTDNSNVSYFMKEGSDTYALEQVDKDFVAEALGEEYQPTHLVINYDGTPTYTGTGETDIIYEEGPIPWAPGAMGFTWCNDFENLGTITCDQAYVRILGAGEYNKFSVCHETGHAVGLVHGDNAYPQASPSNSTLGCMRTGIGDTSSLSGNLGANQVENINGVYP